MFHLDGFVSCRGAEVRGDAHHRHVEVIVERLADLLRRQRKGVRSYQGVSPSGEMKRWEVKICLDAVFEEYACHVARAVKETPGRRLQHERAQGVRTGH